MANKGVVTEFASRHIGTYNPEDLNKMLAVVKADSLDQLIEKPFPPTYGCRNLLIFLVH
jgi:glycine cleavage system pyridoxal-binding protein P